MPLRFLVKTAITVGTPPVVCNSFPLPVTHLTAVEPPPDRRRVASLLFRDCTAVVGLLRRRGGDGGAAAVIVRCNGGHGCAAATPLRIGPSHGCTAEVLNMLKVSAVPPRKSAVLTVFRGATAINGGTTAEPRRSWRCHCGLCRTSTAVAPRIRGDGGINHLLVGGKPDFIHIMPPSHRRRGVTKVFVQNCHHRSDTAPVVCFNSFPYPSHI